MEDRRQSRRAFLGQSAVLAAAAALPAGRARAASPERVLVVVQLAGGNDGLNTLVPLGDDSYYRARPTLAVPARDALRLTDAVGLHPSLGGLQKLWDAGSLAVVQGVGYPQPSRSHFRSLEIWETASASDQHESSGWLGRALERGERSRCVRVGARESLALAGRQSAAELLSRPDNQRWIGDSVDSPAGQLGADLKRVASAIAGGGAAAAYHVSLGGFDTHTRQADTHAALLGELGTALAAFQADLRRRGQADRVLTLVCSEFGRRLHENGARGTDHGTANPVLLVGSSVKPGLHGQAPSLTKLVDGDLRHTTDFRSVYATLLRRWLAVDDKAVLGRSFETLRLV